MFLLHSDALAIIQRVRDPNNFRLNYSEREKTYFRRENRCTRKMVY